MHVNNLFSTPVAISKYLKHLQIKDKLINHCQSLKVKQGGLDWISNSVFNTCGTHNILKDEIFNELNDWIYSEVLKFGKMVGQTNKIVPSDAWFNIYSQNAYQEYHNHNFNYISTIY